MTEPFPQRSQPVRAERERFLRWNVESSPIDGKGAWVQTPKEKTDLI